MSNLGKVLFLFISAATAVAAAAAEPPFVGVNVGTAVSTMLSPEALASFLTSQQITHVRLFEPDTSLLLALSRSHSRSMRVALGIPNNQLLAIGSSPITAARWVSRYILPYLRNKNSSSLVTLVLVGDEVLTSSPSSSPLLLPAVHLLHSALSSAGLAHAVKVSTPLSSSVILNPFPPSQAYFNHTHYLFPLLRFLSSTSSPLVLNLYPYYVVMQNRGVVPLDNALFKPLPPSKEEVDPNTLLHYTNVLDAMIDAAYFSMKTLNFTDVDVLVGETGWPSRGDPHVEPYATRDNAATYTSNLIRRVVVDGAGTPLRPDVTSSVYLYELFDEDLRSGPVSETSWGLFHGNGTPVYPLHVSGAGGFLANDTTNKTFCVAAAVEANERLLQAALDWACGPGRADCEELQPGQACYEPNNVESHASYAFDSYYHKHDKASGSCYFQGVATVTTTDPSHGKCIFPGSKKNDGSARAKANVTDDSSSYGRMWRSTCVHVLIVLTSLLVEACSLWT